MSGSVADAEINDILVVSGHVPLAGAATYTKGSPIVHWDVPPTVTAASSPIRCMYYLLICNYM